MKDKVMWLHRNFHMVPNHLYPMRIGAYPKLVFGYLCRCADSEGQAWPSRATIAYHCEVSVNTVDRAIKVLIENHLVIKEERKLNDNPRRHTSNIYYLNIPLSPLKEALPSDKSSNPAGKNKECPLCGIPAPSQGLSQPPAGATPAPHRDPINTYIYKPMNLSNICQSVMSVPPNGNIPEEQKNRTDKTDRTEYSNRIDRTNRTDNTNKTNQIDETKTLFEYEKQIKINIDYETFISESEELKLVDDFIAIIVDTIATQGGTVRIGGEDKPLALVKSTMMKLNYDDIDIALTRYTMVNTRIRKKKEYIRTLLYNQKLESKADIVNVASVTSPWAQWRSPLADSRAARTA